MTHEHEDFKQDLARCRRLLDREPDACEAQAIIACLLGWVRFWAKQDPDLKIRTIWQSLEVRVSQELALTHGPLH
jgi:hypothetical protein